MNDKPLKSWNTSVPVARSQGVIRELLAQFGASKVTFEDDMKDGTQTLRFEYPYKTDKPIPVQFKIEIAGIYNWLTKGKKGKYAQYKFTEQAKRVAWRHIFDWVKANLNLVEFGLIPFENMFLSYFARVLPNGKWQTVGEVMIPQLNNFHKLLPEGKE